MTDAVQGVLIPNAQNPELKSALEGAQPLFLKHLEHARRCNPARVRWRNSQKANATFGVRARSAAYPEERINAHAYAALRDNYCYPLCRFSATMAQAGDKPARTHTILIKDFAFVPDHLIVSAGDTVVWKNEDIVPHAATGKGVFDSQEIGSMKSWTYKTSRKGKFPCSCTYHPTMRAEITVH